MSLPTTNPEAVARAVADMREEHCEMLPPKTRFCRSDHGGNYVVYPCDAALLADMAEALDEDGHWPLELLMHDDCSGCKALSDFLRGHPAPAPHGAEEAR